MGLLGLVATGVCSMIGAGINVIPFMIQRHVPGIGPNVLPAFIFAALPAVLAGLAYAMLASAMPRAGGSYVYASRALDPYLGFVASFSQWFSLCVAIGVVSYLIVPFLRDIAVAAGSTAVAATLETGPIRLTISLAFLWAAVFVNLRGVKAYERLIVPLMFLTFILGGVVIVAGFSFDHAAFAAALQAREGRAVAATEAPPLQLSVLLPASALLFASFIGFDSIAQAGGEAKHPGRNLPLAIGICVVSVGIFYMLFTGAVYHAVPWQFIAAEAQHRDLTAPGLLGYLLPPAWTVVIVAGAAVALDQGLAGDAARGIAPDVRVGRGWDLSARDRGGASALPHAARGDPCQRLHGHARHRRQPPGRRLLSRRRHPRDLDARQLSADGDLGG